MLAETQCLFFLGIDTLPLYHLPNPGSTEGLALVLGARRVPHLLNRGLAYRVPHLRTRGIGANAGLAGEVEVG